MFLMMSWNVRYFSHYTRGVTSTEKNLQMAAKAIANLSPQPDIIALQEIDNHSIRSTLSRFGRRSLDELPQIERFLTHLNGWSRANGGYEYDALFFKAHGHEKRTPLYSTGLAILYRDGLTVTDTNLEDPHDITHRRLQSFRRIKQRRICAWSRLETEQGMTLDLFNTHLSLPAFLQRTDPVSGRRFGEAQNQLVEIQNVLRYVQERGQSDRTLLVGDFNAIPGSQVYRCITGEAGLKDAFASYYNLDTVALHQFPSAGFLSMRFRLDHVFATPDVAFRQFPHTAPFGPHHPLNGLSDHVPICGRFEFAERADTEPEVERPRLKTAP